MPRRAVVAAVVALMAPTAVGVGLWWRLGYDPSAPEAALDAISRDGGGRDGGGGGGAEGPASPDGRWTIRPNDTVFVGYRVREKFVGSLAERTATGRTRAVRGTLHIDGDRVTAASFTADLTELHSRQARRDSALRHRGIETEQFPEATFELAAPLRLPELPRQGETVEVTATGQLTLHGETAVVQVALESRWDGATISVAGQVPIVLADFGMDAVDVHGLVRTDDQVTLELQLLFVPT
ncbi:MAG TPA: YceI family protein [Acidimicrobiales bacterium]|nr:YceI family protein [Acidimicrobiales bacterium]